jgi:hypothetical protein
MHLFFRIACNIEATQLTDATPFFEKAGYTTLFSVNSFKGFIRSAVYQKQ